MTVSEFRGVFNNLPSNGWLELDEALLLVEAADRTRLWSAPMLEVGSYHGRSSVLLANLEAQDDSVGPDPFKRTLVCVDPWEDTFPAPNKTGEQVFTEFKENVKGLKVTCVRTTIEDYVERFDESIKDMGLPEFPFCYLDGDHSYSGTRSQIEAALKFKARVIAIHDVNDSGGGLEIKKAALELLGPWDERVNRLAVWYLKKDVQYGLKELV